MQLSACGCCGISHWCVDLTFNISILDLVFIYFRTTFLKCVFLVFPIWTLWWFDGPSQLIITIPLALFTPERSHFFQSTNPRRSCHSRKHRFCLQLHLTCVSHLRLRFFMHALQHDRCFPLLLVAVGTTPPA